MGGCHWNSAQATVKTKQPHQLWKNWKEKQKNVFCGWQLTTQDVTHSKYQRCCHHTGFSNFNTIVENNIDICTTWETWLNTEHVHFDLKIVLCYLRISLFNQVHYTNNVFHKECIHVHVHRYTWWNLPKEIRQSQSYPTAKVNHQQQSNPAQRILLHLVYCFV